MIFDYNTIKLKYDNSIRYQGNPKWIKSHQEIDTPGLYAIPGSGSLYIYYDGYKMHYEDDKYYSFEYIDMEQSNE